MGIPSSHRYVIVYQHGSSPVRFPHQPQRIGIFGVHTIASRAGRAVATILTVEAQKFVGFTSGKKGEERWLVLVVEPTQIEKYARQNGFTIPNFRGEHKKYLKPPTRWRIYLGGIPTPH